jgi:hypothetical protein
LKITVSENAGFCPGVRRADEAVRGLISSSDENNLVFTIGHLIHNEIYNEDLEAKGVKAISHEDIPEVLKSNSGKKITFVIRTHGVTKEIFDYLADLKQGNENIFKRMEFFQGKFFNTLIVLYHFLGVDFFRFAKFSDVLDVFFGALRVTERPCNNITVVVAVERNTERHLD